MAGDRLVEHDVVPKLDMGAVAEDVAMRAERETIAAGTQMMELLFRQLGDEALWSYGIEK